jgi:hypothetical protein
MLRHTSLSTTAELLTSSNSPLHNNVRRLATTYSNLSRSGRTPPGALQPPPQPEPMAPPQPGVEFELPNFNFDDSDDF